MNLISYHVQISSAHEIFGAWVVERPNPRLHHLSELVESRSVRGSHRQPAVTIPGLTPPRQAEASFRKCRKLAPTRTRDACALPWLRTPRRAVCRLWPVSEQTLQQMTPAFVLAYWSVPAGIRHKGELDRSVSKCAAPTTTSMTGSHSFTHSGASSPTTTKVNTTHTAVGIATPGDSTPHTTDEPLRRGELEAHLSDGVDLAPRQQGFYLTKDRQIRTSHGEIVLAQDHGPWSVVRTYGPSMAAGAPEKAGVRPEHDAHSMGTRAGRRQDADRHRGRTEREGASFQTSIR